MSRFSLRPVSYLKDYPHHKWFNKWYKYGEKGHSKRDWKKLGKYESFNEDLYLEEQINYYDDSRYKKRIYFDEEKYPDSFITIKKGNDPRWRKVYRMRRKYLNRLELHDIYTLKKNEFIEKYGENRYI